MPISDELEGRLASSSASKSSLSADPVLPQMNMILRLGSALGEGRKEESLEIPEASLFTGANLHSKVAEYQQYGFV